MNKKCDKTVKKCTVNQNEIYVRMYPKTMSETCRATKQQANDIIEHFTSCEEKELLGNTNDGVL